MFGSGRWLVPTLMATAFVAVTGVRLPQEAAAMYPQQAVRSGPVDPIVGCRWPAAAPAPWQRGRVVVADLLDSAGWVWGVHQSIYNGTLRDCESPPCGGWLGLNVRNTRLYLTGTYSATGPLSIQSGGTLVTVPPPSVTSLSIASHGRMYVSSSWSPANGLAIALEAGTTPGFLVVAGTLAAPTGGAISVSGSPGYLPQTLVVASELSGTWSVGSLPAGTRLVQGAATITLESL